MQTPISLSRANRRSTWIAASLLLPSIVSLAEAQTPEQAGRDIAVEADRRARGYHDFTARLTMVLRNRDGKEKTREMRVMGLETADGDRTLVVFDLPRDLQGTALLTVSRVGESDDQWLYLPALKRVKRIASNNQSGSFMGSEFSYEDIGSQELEKFKYRYLGEELVDGQESFVVERVPLDSRSGYSRQVVWLDKKEYRVRRIDYYDRGTERLKTLMMKGYGLHADKYWRPSEMVMTNHRTGKATTLRWSQYEFGAGLEEQDFTRTSLERVRS